MRTILLLSLSAALVSTQLRAEAGSSVVTVSASDLTTPVGMAVLRKGLASAIEQVCGSYAAAEPYQVPEISVCRAAAWKSVQTQIASLKLKYEVLTDS